MMIRCINYNGKDLGEFGVTVDFSQIFRKPAFEVAKWVIPGKNGDIIRPEDRYSNIELQFNCLIRRNFTENFTNLVDYLTSFQGNYGRLETTAEPDVYRMAAFHSVVEPDAGQYLRNGRFTLVFDCQPQRFLKSGEEPILMNEASTTHVMNPTLKPSRPLIRVDYMVGDGSIDINSDTITVEQTADEFWIDCDTMHAYKIVNGAAVSMDDKVSMPDHFVELTAGDNALGTTDIAISIFPRWWKL